MTSSPLRQFFLALSGVLLIGLALYRVTSTDAAAALPALTVQEEDAGTPAVMTVKCAHKPERISISCGSAVIWSAERPGLQTEEECRLPLKDGSVTLTVSAKWPEGTPDTPVTLELEPEGRPSQTATRWSFGSELDDTYAFSWK